uniref:Uncharacterized protein n=1 Tax=Cannabis sativa TaxID=3483 RepID=A0A803NRH3_CANSA
MYLVLAWSTRLAVNRTVLRLSHHSVGGLGSRIRNYENRECNHAIKFEPKKMEKPDVELQSSGSLAQSASLNVVISRSEIGLKNRGSSSTPFLGTTSRVVPVRAAQIGRGFHHPPRPKNGALKGSVSNSVRGTGTINVLEMQYLCATPVGDSCWHLDSSALPTISPHGP